MIYIELSYDKIKLFYKKNKRIYQDAREIENSDCIKNSILNFISEHKIKSKKIGIVLKSDKIHKRFEVYNSLSNRELYKIFSNNVDEFFPIKKEEFVFDYEILSKDRNEVHIMFVAVSKSLIQNYLKIIEEIGLICVWIDFYQNSVSKILNKYFKSKTLVSFMINGKYSFIYLHKGKIVLMRDLNLDFNKDIIMLLNQGLGFYNEEMYSIKNLVFLDDMPLLEQNFSSFVNSVFYNKEKLSRLLSSDINFLALNYLR